MVWEEGGCNLPCRRQNFNEKKKNFFFISLFGKSAKLLSRNSRGGDMERGKLQQNKKSLLLFINWTNFAKLQNMRLTKNFLFKRKTLPRLVFALIFKWDRIKFNFLANKKILSKRFPNPPRTKKTSSDMYIYFLNLSYYQFLISFSFILFLLQHLDFYILQALSKQHG